MGATPTTIPVLTADDFANRLAALIPNGWVSATDKLPGGVMYALLQTLGSQMGFELGGTAYALGSTRIQTAVAPELDLASQDFFGDALPRNPGESDASYRTRILAGLPPQGATREAIVNALFALTGVYPRVIEWWNPSDTGYWDGPCYYDVDSQENPCRWTGPTPYQGFIITPPPPLEVLDGNPLLTWDCPPSSFNTAYWDVAGWGWFQTPASPVGQVYALLNRLKVEGTIIWVQIGNPLTIIP